MALIDRLVAMFVNEVGKGDIRHGRILRAANAARCLKRHMCWTGRWPRRSDGRSLVSSLLLRVTPKFVACVKEPAGQSASVLANALLPRLADSW